jgi:hypothetical protein
MNKVLIRMLMMYTNLLLLSLTLLGTIDGSHLPHLRSSGSAADGFETKNDAMVDVAVTDSNCNTAQGQEHCFRTTDTTSRDACMWCIAGAIPSECMSPEQASLLPPDVFDCASPSALPSTKTKTSFIFDSAVFGTTQIYSLVNNHHHGDIIDNGSTTSATEEQQQPPQPSKSELCDVSSNSLSGYMDISGSEYDQSGENKHLFYWFFEKRDAIDSDVSSADIPVRS